MEIRTGGASLLASPALPLKRFLKELTDGGVLG
jgi:hypothetical protein